MAGKKSNPAGAAPTTADGAAEKDASPGKSPRQAAPESAPAPEEKTVRRRRYGWLWLIPLILLAAGAWLWFQHLRHYPQRMDRLEADVERIAALELEIAELERERAEETADARAARLAGDRDREALAIRLTAAERSLEALGGRPVLEQSRWTLDAADRLLALADRQSRFARDHEGAASAVREALRLLAEVGDPRYGVLRAELQEQARALERIPPRDIQAVVVRLGALLSRVEGLEPVTRPETSAPAPMEALPDDGFRRAVASIRRALRSLVTVRRSEEGVDTLLTQSDTQALRQLLAAELHLARLAYIQGDLPAYSAALVASRARLARLHSPANPDVADTLSDIDELLELGRSPDTPDIAASLERLRSIRSD